MNFSWQKSILYGVGLWAVMFAVVSLFVGFDVAESLWTELAVMGVSTGLAYWFAHRIDVRSLGIALGYGVMWVGIGLALDLIISYRFNDEIFRSWQLWTGYALVLLAPMARSFMVTDVSSGKIQLQQHHKT